MTALIGIKLNQDQVYNQSGRRLAVTRLLVGPCVVVSVVNQPEQQRQLITLGLVGTKKTKKHPQPVIGQLKKAKIKHPNQIIALRQFILPANETYQLGQTLTVADLFTPGQLIDITGVTKGRGFTGVMKRWGFAGGPRTHGQSDRPRSPGSIGGGTTPGRVYKGKKMAGRFGGYTQTVKNALVLDLNTVTHTVTVKGLIPGHKAGLLTLISTGRTKNFSPLEKSSFASSAPSVDSKDSSPDSEKESTNKSQSTIKSDASKIKLKPQK